MKPIPFVGGAYEARSLPADSQFCINLYIEQDQAGGKESVLYGTPGLTLEYTLPTGPVRGMSVMNGRMFLVGGAKLYETTSGTPIAVGTLESASGAVSMTNNDSTLLIVDGTGGYIYGSTFAKIADPDFPNGVTKAAWEGQYFIVGVDGSKQFFVSGLGTGSSWNGLDFASAENKPETLVSLVVNHDRLILFTSTGAEQWVNTGNAEFAFERDNGSSIEVGCEARDSVVTMNNGVYWLGRDRDGGGMVFMLQGGVPQRISTHAIEGILQNAPNRNEAYAFAYQQAGHSFYCLTIPSLDRTFVYDAAVQKWTERAEWAGRYKHWQPNCHAYNGKHYVGDYSSGNVYSLDLNKPADRWMRQAAPITNNMERMTISMLEIDMEVGVSPNGTDGQIRLEVSKDGKNFQDVRVTPVGKIGMTRQRVRYPRLGMARRWVFRVSGSDVYSPRIYGAYIE